MHSIMEIYYCRLFPFNFEVLEFSYFDTRDSFNKKWVEWSRIYEYEFVKNRLLTLGANANSKVHNSCWGYQGCHITFKNELASQFPHLINSDIQYSSEINTSVYDLTKKCPQYWKNEFDFVINISTMEEIFSSQLLVLRNLIQMLKSGGHLILTFDFPGLKLELFEKLLDDNIKIPDFPLKKRFPNRSDVPDHLMVGYLVIRRNKS